MLVVKSVPKVVGRKSFFATLSVLVMVATTLFGARVAEADSTWYQSYQRASQEQACVAQPGETPWQDSWGTNPGWSPSWEQWANNGNGGWVCSRSITWARSPLAEGSTDASCDVQLSYSVGDIGPGCGLVFLVFGGKTYEVAPKNWGGDETSLIQWCSNTLTSVAGTFGTAIGTGSANTDLMLAGTPAACSSGAAVSARAYRGGGFTDWFLPSKDELNAMYLYSQVVGFDTATYGFANSKYWSSSQDSTDTDAAWDQNFSVGDQIADYKDDRYGVRPVRAF